LQGIKLTPRPAVEIQDRVYLLSTPELNGYTHDGTDVFRFQDIATGELESSNGVPVVLNRIPRQTEFNSTVGAGQSDCDEGNSVGGVLFPQYTEEQQPLLYQISQTGMGPAAL
jgi:hypothetical protein